MRVGAENPVTSCDLDVLVQKPAKPISSEHADGRQRNLAGCRLRAGADAVIGEVGGC